jgi:hypothetical protein
MLRNPNVHCVAGGEEDRYSVGGTGTAATLVMVVVLLVGSGRLQLFELHVTNPGPGPESVLVAAYLPISRKTTKATIVFTSLPYSGLNGLDLVARVAQRSRKRTRKWPGCTACRLGRTRPFKFDVPRPLALCQIKAYSRLLGQTSSIALLILSPQ